MLSTVIMAAVAGVLPLSPFHTEHEEIFAPPPVAEEAKPESSTEEDGPQLLNGTWLDGRVCFIGGDCTDSKSQHDWAKEHRIAFMHTNRMYREAINTGHFVRLHHPKLIVLARRPYVLPATAKFIYALAEDFAEAGCGPLTVTGAGRLTSERPSTGSIYSVHPTGMAVDLRVRNLSQYCELWLNGYLEAMEQEVRIDATREHNPPHFHTVVLPEISTPARVYYVAQSTEEATRPEQ